MIKQDILVCKDKQGFHLVMWAIIDPIPYSHAAEELMKFAKPPQGANGPHFLVPRQSRKIG